MPVDQNQKVVEQQLQKQISQHFGLIKQASNEALMGLIVESLQTELRNQPHQMSLVSDFMQRDLPWFDQDFTRLKAAEQLIPMLAGFEGKEFAQAVLFKHNQTVNKIDQNLSKEKQLKVVQKSLERMAKSLQVIPLDIDQSFTKQACIAQKSTNEHKYKFLNMQSICANAWKFFKNTPNQDDTSVEMSRVFSGKMLDYLIKKFNPLLADKTDRNKKGTSQPQEPQAELKQNQTAGDTSKISSKDMTKKQMEKTLMGDLANLKSIKLSDFIDESFLEDLDKDLDQEVSNELQNKKPMADFVTELEQAVSPDGLPDLGTKQTQQNKRRKISESGESFQATHLILSPLLAQILQESEKLLNHDWQRRQVAACQLKAAIKTLCAEKRPSLSYYVACISSDSKKLTIQSQESISLPLLIRNILPRAFFFLLKDNFSDFAGLKALMPAREEALKLLAEIQYFTDFKENEHLYDKQSMEDLKQDLQIVLRLLPLLFVAVEKDLWHSRLNFFLIVKSLVLKSAPESDIRSRILKMFTKLLVQSLPQIEDEPKVAITETLQILLPTLLRQHEDLPPPYTAQSQIVQIIERLLHNLGINLSQSDEIEASSIAVFNLVCKVFDLKEQFKCLKPLNFKLSLQIFTPFTFHRIEAVRFSYFQILLKSLQQEVQNFDEIELGQLHTLTLQALAMESSQKLVKILFKILKQIVHIFQSLDHEVPCAEDASQMVIVSPYAEYLRQVVLLDDYLPSWLFDVVPKFETFLFVDSHAFESIEQDYFQIVFKPANDQEWEVFYNQKTKNLTKAIAIMMSECRGTGEAANLIFEMLCSRTITYDQNLETGQYDLQRTLLNQSMLQMMIVIDRYTRILWKDVENGSRSEINSNQGGVIDLPYLLILGQQFLQASEHDVNIMESWQRDAFLDSIRALSEQALIRNCHHIGELLRNVDFYMEDFGRSQSFQAEIDFKNTVMQIVDWISANGDQVFISYMQGFYATFQHFTFYTVEYTYRLKAYSASTILNLAHLIKLQPQIGDLSIDRQLIAEYANLIVKPLLSLVNQERILYIKEHAAQSLVNLLLISHHFEIEVLGQKTTQLIYRMMQEEVTEIDHMASLRDQTLQYFVKQLSKAAKNTTIYELYGGNFGYELLKPTWVNQEVKGGDELQKWLRALYLVLKSLKGTKSETQIRKRYEQFAQNTIINLLVKALSNMKDQKSMKGENHLLLPQLIDLIFPTLIQIQREKLAVALLNQLELKQRAAFDILDCLLDSQLQSQKTSMDFLTIMPAFILPVIKAIQAQQVIYGNQKGSAKGSVMKILAKLIQLLPLNLASIRQQETSGKQDTSSSKIKQNLLEKAKQGMRFLEVFTENKLVEDYEITVPMKSSIKLRHYQREGINWMAQLGELNLNCILCDDMGLGKTLQSLCVVLNEAKKVKDQQIKDFGKITANPLNLVVCPTSLTYNWLNEINKFFEGQKVGVIEGSQKDRELILSNLQKYDILIVNYEKLKACLPYFEETTFFYTVLDEAHRIKNSKAVVTQSVKQLKSERKLALSGTPLQNKVSELWSLFDYLMPDFLEEETVFNKTYNKYLTANLKRMQEKLDETQSFIEALKGLKRRIAPFILRRTKEQVMKELPPKVIQDYTCSMTPIQAQAHLLVEKEYPFAQTSQGTKGSNGEAQVKQSALKNLIMHRKVCNHPSLISEMLTQDQVKNVFQANQSTNQYNLSGKLIGLIEVLQQCDIISNVNQDEQNGEESKTASSNKDLAFVQHIGEGKPDQSVQKAMPHRALIFCQMSSFMNLICTQVLQKFGIRYSQLLGSMNSRERIEKVTEFNEDISVRVLILTTSVGGLGLTLTGADVVIFAEHDWNPMNDLQAMDRAHRIGQTRTVNVFRLILKDTLEEKIMSLQRFKENLAKSLITEKGGDITTQDAQNLEINDLLQSFEQHTSYKKVATKGEGLSKEEKEAQEEKEAKQLKKMVYGGMAGALQTSSTTKGVNEDIELEEIEKIWEACSDTEQL